MAAKKRRSVAKKKGSAKKKSATRAKSAGARRLCLGPPKAHIFTLKCTGANCIVVPRSKHMCPGDFAVLIARGTNATIDFVASSPFVSGTDPISLLDGVPRVEEVGSTHGTFRYNISCGACQSVLHIPPEMIVP